MAKRHYYFILIFLAILIIIFYFYIEYNNINIPYDFYETYYSSLVTKNGVLPAFTELKNMYEKDAATKEMCHQITHIIGRASAKKYGNAGNAFKFGDSFCWSGY